MNRAFHKVDSEQQHVFGVRAYDSGSLSLRALSGVRGVRIPPTNARAGSRGAGEVRAGRYSIRAHRQQYTRGIHKRAQSVQASYLRPPTCRVRAPSTRPISLRAASLTPRRSGHHHSAQRPQRPCHFLDWKTALSSKFCACARPSSFTFCAFLLLHCHCHRRASALTTHPQR